MTWKARAITLLSSLPLLSALWIASATSGKQVHQSNPPPTGKIAPWVLEKTGAGREAEFLVVMKDRTDLSSSATLRSKAEKGRYVRDALYARAQQSQSSLLDWLRANNIKHRSFYIVNAVLVTGSREIAETIAARADVARIEGNPTVRNDLTVQPTPEELAKELEAAARRINAPEAIEPGVTFIRAPEVWAAGFTGQGIVIGGADTGIQWNHPALINKYRGWDGATANHNFNWHDSIHTGGGACGPNSPAPCDDDNHGTHTVGTVLGSDAGNTNQIGVAPGAKFIGCRNMDQGNGTPATYIECMEWFLAPYPVNGTPAQGDPSKAPDLTTNSWGCPPSEGCAPATLQQAVEAQRAAGIMFVAAAGNSGSGCSTVSDPPSFYDATYTIGAISASTGNIASFSSRGPALADGSNRTKPDITAPGVSVRSAIRGGGYASLSGTSMATPHTAGAIALLWSARPGLKNQIAQTENVLNEAAVDVASALCNSNGIPNNVYGWGRLDIKAAYDLGAASISPTSANFAASGGVGTVSVTAPSGFNWTSTSNAPWIGIISGSGNGNGSMTYSVFANTGPARSGTITVAGNLFTVNQAAAAPPSATARKSDFDGDGSTDLSIWRGASGAWMIIPSGGGPMQTTPWGASSDSIVPGDFDGDRKTDIAYWQPSDGAWNIIRSSNGQTQSTPWGAGFSPYNDVPVPGDYDGDGRTDLAVWRRANGTWFILQSSTGQFQATNWGAANAPYNDTPVQSDYDGDGRTDIAVWRQSDGNWYVLKSSTGQFQVTGWGSGLAPYNDQAVPADYDGDGKADIAVWRPLDGNWYVLKSSNGQFQITSWGLGAPYNDVPVPGDYDGDGRADIGVWRSSTGVWFVIRSSNGSFLIQTHGQNGDTALPSRQR